MSASRELFGRAVVVTGAAQGIGACIASAYARRGASVVLVDRKAGEGRRRESLLRAGGDQALFLRCDLSDAAAARSLFSAIAKRFGRVHALINNAGIFDQMPLSRRAAASWDGILSVNLRAAFLASQALSAALARGGGSIVNIASTRAFMSEPGTEPYSASKGGLVALTHSLAVSLAPQRVRVNCISPGWIDTSAWLLPPRKAKLRKVDHEQHPAGRVGRPEDVAEACLFLTSPERAGFITGQNLTVDGGMTVKMIYAE